ncbi:MAG: hypothetical protein K2G24_05320 [Muribaculaceae bacterium]|nr:hypothetical protein [Muribaculaceae bacterium]
MKRLLIILIASVSALYITAASPTFSDTRKAGFTWGAEMGGSVDMSGNDMSTVDFNISFGLKYRWLKMAGIGAGADIMVSNPCRTFPVYCEFQSDFSSKPQLLFLCLKGGAAFNYLENNEHSTGAYAFGGLGINFARTAKFSSYMTVGYTLIQRPDKPDAEFRHDDIHMATIKLGINF